ncbi:MAG: hypothetical protein ACKVJU_19050 [Verrucomicrobiales bacterium]
MACGAVETPRLLLNSANQHAPDGLANESGLNGPVGYAQRVVGGWGHRRIRGCNVPVQVQEYIDSKK